MSQIKKYFIIAALALSSSKALALELKLNSQGLNPTQKITAKTALRDVQDKLPALMKSRLQTSLTVTFTEGSEDAEHIHLGMASYASKEISLNVKLLGAEGSRNASHFTPEKLRRTLAHEIAHFYDRSAGLSSDPSFMALMGWRKETIGAKQINNFKRRLPDVYMNTSLVETFPTAFEFFLYDSDFQCRMPEVARALSVHFKTPVAAPCETKMSWFMSSPAGTPQFVEVDRSRIWAIDFLWASEGQGMASKFGHAMIRMVVCAADRTPGPDCYKDVNHHIILSYAALSAGGSFASVDGLAGNYPLNLYAMSFAAAKLQYNMTELRDLYAVPLKMSALQRNQLLDILYAQHWNLNADYYFLSQNCATEIARDLIAIGLGKESALQTNSPRDLFDRLLKNGVSSYGSRESLKKNPLLYFSSSQKTVDKAILNVSAAAGLSIKDVEDYFTKVDTRIINKLVKANPDNSRLLYSMYYLEGMRAGRALAEYMMASLEDQAQNKEVLQKSMEKQAGAMFTYRFAGSFLGPSTYGIPTSEEVQRVQERVQENIKSDMERLQKSYGSKVENIISQRSGQVLILKQRQEWLLRLATESTKR